MKNSDRIPFELLRPIVAEYLEQYETAPNLGFGRPLPLSPSTILANEVGIKPDTFYQLINGRMKSVRFEVADSLLCAMGVVTRWFVEPLLSYYWEGRVPPDTAKPVKCANPTCAEWFSLDPLRTESWNRRYCSEYCKTAAWRAQNPKHDPVAYRKTPEGRAAYNAYMREYRRTEVAA